MRKERWIVPVVVVLAIAWAAAQYVASLLFERELARALADLQARGDLRVTRSDVAPGWLSSRGTIHLSPLLGHSWHLALPYEARHGVLDTSVVGQLSLHVGEQDRRLFGDSLPSAPPRWEAHYRTLGGTLKGELRLAPFVISQTPPRQSPRLLRFEGGRIAFDGVYGDWRTRIWLAPWRLSDGDALLEVGPSMLESRYAYTPGALHFTQHDKLTIEQLSLRHPRVDLDGQALVVETRTLLDDSELRLQSQMTVGEVRSGEQMLLDGTATLDLSRINATALRELISILQRKTALGTVSPADAESNSALDRALVALLKDSPRLDLRRVDLASPMLGLAVKGDGALIFDARQLDELSPMALDDPAMRERFRRRLDGDFEWEDVPAVVALWLGQPLDTRSVTVDVVKGRVRINGRPLPPLFDR